MDVARFGLVVQLAEQRPFKAWVAGSSPAKPTNLTLNINKERKKEYV